MKAKNEKALNEKLPPVIIVFT